MQIHRTPSSAILATFVALTTAFAVAQAEAAFRDTFTRADGPLAVDSLGATEGSMGWTALDYRELDATGGRPSAFDVARINGGRLVVSGNPGTTNPAFAEIDSAGANVSFDVTATFLLADPTPSSLANSMALFLRNGGLAIDGSIFTLGLVLFELEPDGFFLIRGIVSVGSSPVVLGLGRVDSVALRTADLDADGRLERNEPFQLALRVNGPFFGFAFNGVPQVTDLYLAGLVVPPDAGNHLLLGRNRISSSRPVAVNVAFDDLRTEGAPDQDGDGSPVDQDCDDSDPTVHPGAAEACNGEDDDCDSVIGADEMDNDGDGTRVCGGDCNDGDSAVHPSAEERCNGLDDDCDESIPASESDHDGDGSRVCDRDCNDSDSNVHPGALDLPGDDLDQDCDGARTCDPTQTWRSKGAYLECVNSALREMRDAGLITQDAARRLKAEASRRNVPTQQHRGNGGRGGRRDHDSDSGRDGRSNGDRDGNRGSCPRGNGGGNGNRDQARGRR